MRSDVPGALAFLCDAGDAPGWCGVSESLLGLIRSLQPVPLCITAGPNGLTGALRAANLPVEVLPFPIIDLARGRFQGVYGYSRAAIELLRYSARILRTVRRNRAVVLYVTGFVPSIAAGMTTGLGGFEMVLGIRGKVANSLAFRFACRRAAAIVALSEEMRGEVAGCYREPERAGILQKVRVIYNGVDISRAHSDSPDVGALKSTLTGNSSRVLVLVNGNLNERKNQLALISEVIPRVSPDGPDRDRFTFVLIGEAVGEYADACRRAVAERGLDGIVRIEGLQSNPWTWMSASDIVVLGSRSEGMPRAVIEAMACGKPVVCTRVTSVSELLEASGAGVVTEQGDYNSMASAIARLGRDAGLREQMGAAGRRFVQEHCDLRRIAAQYTALFGEVHARRTA